MILILDFDNTLFNTAALVRGRDAVSNDQINPLDGLDDDLSQFVFADTLPFLKEYKNNTIIILSYSNGGTTGYGNAVYQREKIKRSGITSHVNEVIITEGELKGSYIKDISARISYNEPVVFLDDRANWLREAHDMNPEIYPVCILREDREFTDKDNEFHTVIDLQEFSNYLKRETFS